MSLSKEQKLNTLKKALQAVWFKRENGTNTCSSERWKAHCDEWDEVEFNLDLMFDEIKESE